MSGIEIAGLVLGALPLLIAALQGYKKGLTPIETFLWKWKKELETLTRCLKHHRVLFRQNMIRLLAAASLSEETELAKQDEILVVMQRPEVCEAIARYLADGQCLEFFVEVLEECGMYLEEIACNLQHIQRPSKGGTNLKTVVQANPPQTEGYAFKERFNFTMKHKEMKRLVDQIDACNDKLERFLDSVDRINQLKEVSPTDRSNAPAKLLASSLHKIWNHANTLHSAVKTYCPKTCHQTHQAMLFLETRIDVLRESTQHQAPKFRLLFPLNHDISTETRWSESEIQVLEMNSPSDTTKEIKDLCSHFAQSNPLDKAYNMELTKERKLFCGVTPEHETWILQDLDSKAISLGHHLKLAKTVPPFPKDITMLALILASSLLQLTRTDWVDCRWTKDVIKVFTSKKRSKDIVQWTKPVITTTFPPTKVLSQDAGVKEELLDLGIVLLEIWEQQTFESWLESVGSTYVEEYYCKMSFAIKWLESAQERWPLSYSDAVSACVRFSFEGVAHRWDHPEFRRAVCQKVIAPLQQNCAAWVHSA